MKCLFPIPEACLDQLKRASETGIGYQIVAVHLRDGRCFEQVVVSECCIIEVRDYAEIPFTPYDVASVSINHKRWNFRDGSDIRAKCRAATA
jgi:hypothetical protein